MSTVTGTTPATGRGRTEGIFRVAALVGVLVLTWSYVSVLRDVAVVVGGTDLLVPVVAVTLVAATAAAYLVDERSAAIVTVFLVVVGYGYYLVVTPDGLSLLVGRTGKMVADVTALLTGLPVIRLARADIWALGFVPAPAFLSWYLALRRRYLAGVVVGGVALLFLVLTSDAGVGGTLAGMVGGIAAVGFGELHRRGGTFFQADVVVVLIAIITVAGLTLSVVPGGAADPLRLGGGGGDTVEGTTVGSPDEMDVVGSVSLSPEVRFTVTADEEQYWRTGVYDRYTGDGWVRTGQPSPYDGELPPPGGPRRTVVQTYTVESGVETMPAVAEPVEVIGDASENTEITAQGTLRPVTPFIEGDRYRVRSHVPDATPAELRNASTDYPAYVEERYLELPDSTTDRTAELTAGITAEAEDPYEAAALVQAYLERNKEYSLEVDKPDGDVADGFLFEMDAGYCTYFATTMTVMLRSEGIPARIATGYSPGQQVEDDTWVVRGMNAHVWVEVYFPEYGWVQFDPTPAGPRSDLRSDSLEDAREGGGDGGTVDTDESEDLPADDVDTDPTTPEGTPAPGEDPPGDAEDPTAPLGPNLPDGLPNPNDSQANGTLPGTGNDSTGEAGSGDYGLPSVPLPSRERMALGAILLFGLAAGAHRTGAVDGTVRAARIRWQGPRRTPEEDVERAYERMELLLGKSYRERYPGETRRDYVDALSIVGVDDRARRVVRIYERARYRGDVDRESAEEAIELVDRMVAERTPVLGRIRRRIP